LKGRGIRHPAASDQTAPGPLASEAEVDAHRRPAARRGGEEPTQHKRGREQLSAQNKMDTGFTCVCTDPLE
jgi:hypothetical protein